jgi:predicted aspartyl protease
VSTDAESSQSETIPIKGLRLHSKQLKLNVNNYSAGIFTTVLAKSPVTKIKINGHTVCAMLDTGSVISIINESFAKEIGLKLKRWPNQQLITVDGRETKPKYFVQKVEIDISGNIYECDCVLMKALKPKVILGMDILRAAEVEIKFSKGKKTELVTRRSKPESVPKRKETSESKGKITVSKSNQDLADAKTPILSTSKRKPVVVTDNENKDPKAITKAIKTRTRKSGKELFSNILRVNNVSLGNGLEPHKLKAPKCSLGIRNSFLSNEKPKAIRLMNDIIIRPKSSQSVRIRKGRILNDKFNIKVMDSIGDKGLEIKGFAYSLNKEYQDLIIVNNGQRSRKLRANTKICSLEPIEINYGYGVIHRHKKKPPEFY